MNWLNLVFFIVVGVFFFLFLVSRVMDTFDAVEEEDAGEAVKCLSFAVIYLVVLVWSILAATEWWTS